MSEILPIKEVAPSDYVIADGDNLKTTSRIVAEKFGKPHKSVIRNIKALMQGVRRHNFVPTPYIDSQGKEQLEYTMDQRSYGLLAMRFTGKEALKVQEAFVDAFEAMKKYIEGKAVDSATAVPCKAEDIIGEFEAYTKAAKMFGLNDNQAVLCSNKAVKRLYGLDFHETLQIEMKSTVQARLYSPTDLGKTLGLSPQGMNKKLAEKGMQSKNASGDWIPSEKGKSFCELLDANKKHSDGTPIQQLKWYDTVLKELS